MQPLAHLCCTQCRLQCIGLHPQMLVWTGLQRERSFCLSGGDCAQDVLHKIQPVGMIIIVIEAGCIIISCLFSCLFLTGRYNNYNPER